MSRKSCKYAIMAAMISFAAYGNAGTATVSPSLAACSKALVETLAKSDTLPAYEVKPAAPASAFIEPDAYVVYAHSKKTKSLLAKASCKATPEGEIVSFKTYPLKG